MREEILVMILRASGGGKDAAPRLVGVAAFLLACKNEEVVRHCCGGSNFSFREALHLMLRVADWYGVYFVWLAAEFAEVARAFYAANKYGGRSDELMVPNYIFSLFIKHFEFQCLYDSLLLRPIDCSVG
ncbi:uncharacterized protein LOC143886508 isoform X2 [Tasmannia lanceolata]|uniref:uncharacterized protein LOC143886508 isoform X2 n=1 Tax=Tasmannia lanceolata TaxID=3420 RepID=UPI00406462AC